MVDKTKTLEREIEKLRHRIKELHESAGDVLKDLRVNGNCVNCGSRIGKKHNEGCVAWKIVSWRTSEDKTLTGEVL